MFSRLLLYKQDQISKIEARLLALDKTDEVNDNGEYLMSHSQDTDGGSMQTIRLQLMEDLEKKAQGYGKSYRLVVDLSLNNI